MHVAVNNLEVITNTNIKGSVLELIHSVLEGMVKCVVNDLQYSSTLIKIKLPRKFKS